jgi:hypothetical protein
MEVKSRERLEMARTALNSKQIESAIIYYFQALNWYSPIGSSQAAAKELYALGLSLSDAKDEQLAYQAFLRLRAGLNASRSIYFPNKDLLTNANNKIALYLAKLKVGQTDNPTELHLEAERYFQIYQNSPITNERWYLLILIGFFLWTISGIKTIFILFSNKESPFKAKLHLARLPIVLFVFGYALWMISMRIA